MSSWSCVPASLRGNCCALMWNIATGDLLWVFEGESGEIGSLAFAPDGKALVYCDHDAVGVIDVQTGKIAHTLVRTSLTPRQSGRPPR